MSLIRRRRYLFILLGFTTIIAGISVLVALSPGKLVYADGRSQQQDIPPNVSATTIATSSVSPIPTTSVTPTCTGWSIVPSPNITTSNPLYAVSAFSPNDIWAVGAYYDGYKFQTLTLHWDGTAWSVIPSPNDGTTGAFLYAVTTIASDDVWAVGHYRTSSRSYSLTLHWDGAQWSNIPAPSSGTRSNFLYGVAATATDNVWAVGGYINDAGLTQTLTMQWNGAEWNIVPSPNMGTGINNLKSITTLAFDDIWAIGDWSNYGDHPFLLALHWDGSQWNTFSGPHGYYSGVTAVSSTDAWAVGFTGGYLIAIAHWDGTTWSSVPTAIDGSNHRLRTIAATGPNDVWAVGSYTPPDTYARLLMLHWDGTSWSRVAIPYLGEASNLEGIDVVGANDIWAVGSYGGGGESGTLIEHYTGPCATPTPVPGCQLQFTDVPRDSTFYPHIRCLACRGIVSGYADGTFRPNNEITRGQLAKLVSNAAAFSEDPGPQIYEDVPPGNSFYWWVNRLSRRGYMGGYLCGGPGEACSPGNSPYFRPGANATRAQTAKIVSNAAQYSETPNGYVFGDVPPSHPFYLWIQRLGSRNIMQGYLCGGVNEPCDDRSRRYFRPGNNVTRGQASKIVANTFYPACYTP